MLGFGISRRRLPFSIHMPHTPLQRGETGMTSMTERAATHIGGSRWIKRQP